MGWVLVLGLGLGLGLGFWPAAGTTERRQGAPLAVPLPSPCA